MKRKIPHTIRPPPQYSTHIAFSLCYIANKSTICTCHKKSVTLQAKVSSNKKMTMVYDNVARSRIYSSLFSARVVQEVLNGQYTSINRVCNFFQDDKRYNNYLDYLTYLYHFMVRYYRCEYVFKNEVINKILLRHFTNKNTISFSEFRVDKSIADLVMFNGISRAYEIKTDYDSDKRLTHQLVDYSKLFDKCYLVTSPLGAIKYEKKLPDNIGIIVFEYKKNSLVHHIIREAKLNDVIDISTLMRSIRTTEYKSIVKDIYGTLPNVSDFDMFEECEKLLIDSDNKKIRTSFLRVMKQRKTNTQSLEQFDQCFRQLGVATNMTLSDYHSFVNNLSIPIKL